MSNILIINGAKEFAHSKGQLNDTLTEVADGFLRDAGHDVKVVRADSSYDVKAEVQNFLWADVIIWQMPGWWISSLRCRAWIRWITWTASSRLSWPIYCSPR